MAAAAMLSAFGLGGGALWVALINRPKMSAEASAATAAGETTVSADARAWAEFHSRETQEAKAEAKVARERATAAEDRLDSLEDKFDLIVGYVGNLKDQIVALGGDPMPPPRDLIPPLSHP